MDRRVGERCRVTGVQCVLRTVIAACIFLENRSHTQHSLCPQQNAWRDSKRGREGYLKI